MKRKTYRKSVTALVSLLAVLFIAVGGTLAFLVDSSGPITNIFNPSEVTTEVIETLEGSTKSNVQIKNTGDTEAYIRVAVVVTWQDKDGNVYGKTPAVETDYTITLPENSKWDMETSDGFYYYTLPVAAGACTENLYNSITAKDTAPSGYALAVEIIGSGIQSVPTSVVATEWGVTVAADATISK